MHKVLPIISATSSRNGQHSEALGMLRAYSLITLIEIVFISIRLYAIKDVSDPIMKIGYKYYVYNIILLIIEVISFVSIKFTKGRIHKSVILICVCIFVLAEYEIVSEVDNDIFLTLLHLFALYPLIIGCLNEMELTKRLCYIMEGAIITYLYFRSAVSKYVEHKDFPIGLSFSFISCFGIILFQSTSSHYNIKEVYDINLRKLQAVIDLAGTWYSECNY